MEDPAPGPDMWLIDWQGIPLGVPLAKRTKPSSKKVVRYTLYTIIINFKID